MADAIILTLFNTATPETKKPQYYVWGSFDYMHLEEIDTISEIASRWFKFKNSVPTTIESRQIYLHTNPDLRISENTDPWWIFRQNDAMPLITITFVLAQEVDVLDETLEKLETQKNIEFERYETLGQGQFVIVFRSISYHHVLQAIRELNLKCTSTFSISSVDNFYNNNLEDARYDKFKKAARDFESRVRVKIILVNGDQQPKRVEKAVKQVEANFATFKSKHRINRPEELDVQYYYEIGQYDLELRIKGYLPNILRMLLDKDLGFTNIASEFYSKYVSHSKTIWQSDYRTLEDEKQK